MAASGTGPSAFTFSFGAASEALLGLLGILLGNVAERVLRLAAAERLRYDQHGLSLRHERNMAPILMEGEPR